ncbi:MAG: tetraacyldisaccharide 4'-kinase [Prolixibacteraceae bacterium]|nr:tetraacyldisaccharide 4'-kinase [Prolixibacteraceae bacterium]
MLKYLLYPFALLYGFIVSFRNFLYDTKILHTSRFSIPILSVGNLTVGGTGKTPHAEYLISLLKQEFNIAYLSRGYKRKTKGFVIAGVKSTYIEVGDEPVQIKQKFPEITVAVCEKRDQGIRELTNNKNYHFDVIILDDAFQHRSVEPHINILLVDYTRPVFDDHLLPVGRLRESVRSRYRANVIIYTKCPGELKPIEQRIIKNRLNIRPYQDLFFTRIQYGEITPAEKGLALFNDDMRNYKVLLITGIANPSPLIDYLNDQVGTIIHKKYPDHHAYRKEDIFFFLEEFNKIESERKLIITTEKDLVRLKSVKNCPETFFRNVYYIPIEIKFLDRARELFNYRVLNYVRENKSNNRFH